MWEIRYEEVSPGPLRPGQGYATRKVAYLEIFPKANVRAAPMVAGTVTAGPVIPLEMERPVAGGGDGGGSVVEKLKELQAMKDAGVLDQDEFKAAKAKLLNTGPAL